MWPKKTAASWLHVSTPLNPPLCRVSWRLGGVPGGSSYGQHPEQKGQAQVRIPKNAVGSQENETLFQQTCRPPETGHPIDRRAEWQLHVPCRQLGHRPRQTKLLFGPLAWSVIDHDWTIMSDLEPCLVQLSFAASSCNDIMTWPRTADRSICGCTCARISRACACVLTAVNLKISNCGAKRSSRTRRGATTCFWAFCSLLRVARQALKIDCLEDRRVCIFSHAFTVSVSFSKDSRTTRARC